MSQTKRLEKSKKINSLASIIVSAIWIVMFCITDVRGESQYELPVGFSAQSILPPELLKGNNFKVADDVVSYGFTNYYSIKTPFGVFEEHGNRMLQTRILELQAIAALEEIKKSKAFSKAAKQAAMNPIKGVWSLITHPVDTVTGVPKGLWKYMSRVDEMVQGDLVETEDSITKEPQKLAVKS